MSARRVIVVAACAAAMFVSTSTVLAAVPDGTTGPSSSDAPYLVRQVPGVTLTSVLTTATR